MDFRAVITATGSFVPENVVDNSDLPKIPPSLIRLIEQKTGVKSRRFADQSQCTSDLAIIAARRCLEKAEFDPDRLNAIILATSSPDRLQPATATRIQHAIGAMNAFAFDVNSVCSGAVFALAAANSMIRSGFCENVLVLAAEVYSKYLDPADFSTYPYFGDGAGAVLLTAQTGVDKGIIMSILKTNGSKADVIQVPAGGTMLPFHQIKNPKDVYFKMIGKEVYDFAVTKGSEIIRDIINRANVQPEAIRFIIPHQANINIIREISARLNIPIDKFLINLDKYGNTAAASIFIAMDELLYPQDLNSGDLILLVAFGGGLSWGANLIKY